jgi:hypothetical protein
MLEIDEVLTRGLLAVLSRNCDRFARESRRAAQPLRRLLLAGTACSPTSPIEVVGYHWAIAPKVNTNDHQRHADKGKWIKRYGKFQRRLL